MEKLYEENPFLTHFPAQVESCTQGKKGFDISLNQTAFYPEGGGQPYDTGLLGGVQSGILAMSRRISPFGATIVTAVLTAAVGCNQTLSIILTKQLCEDIVPDNRALAIDLENTAVVIAPLIPWAIAGAVPLASVNAPTASLWFAVYLYLLPIWNLLVQLRGRRAAKAA